jgi:bacteriocin-like protein
MEKEAVKVSLSDEELNTISGGSVVTKQVIVNGQEALITFGHNLVGSVAGKNEEGGNDDVFKKGPTTILR